MRNATRVLAETLIGDVDDYLFERRVEGLTYQQIADKIESDYPPLKVSSERIRNWCIDCIEVEYVRRPMRRVGAQ